MSTFKVGDRVGLVVEEMGDEDKYGVIVEVIQPAAEKTRNNRHFIQSASYKVRYDDGEERTEYEGYMVPEDEARVENTRLKQEWQTIDAQAKPLLDNAASLISQAAKITKQNGHDLSEMFELTRGLLRAIDEAGWRTSSLSC